MPIIALDLNSIHLTSALISRTGKIKTIRTSPVNDLSGEDITKLIISEIDSLIRKHSKEHLRITSVGISVPGIYNPQTGNVWAPNLPGWEDYPLKEKLLPLIQKHVLILKIASKRSCNIRGEYWQGAARKTKNAIYFSVNNGIGAGILIDGRILEGYNGGVGAVGWMNLNKNFDKKFMDSGFYEYYASGKGIINRVKELLAETESSDSFLKKTDHEKLNIASIFDAYYKKDKIARQVINQAINYWGISIANMISLFNPEKIIFGGHVFGPGFQFIDQIKEIASQRTHPQFFNNVKFVQSELGNYSALIGAGQLVNKKI